MFWARAFIVYVLGQLHIQSPADKFKNVRPCVPDAHVQTQSAKKNDSGLELMTTQNISPEITQNNFPNHKLALCHFANYLA
jgi:hypothetical protein